MKIVLDLLMYIFPYIIIAVLIYRNYLLKEELEFWREDEFSELETILNTKGIVLMDEGEGDLA